MKRFVLFVGLTNSLLSQAGELEPAPSALPGLLLDDLSVTREHPLFTPGRRPPRLPRSSPALPQAAISPSPSWSESQPPFELVGAAIGTNSSFALLRETASGKFVRVHIGDEVEGWRVWVLELREVTVEKAGQFASLKLTEEKDLNSDLSFVDAKTPISQQLSGSNSKINPQFDPINNSPHGKGFRTDVQNTLR